jgi:hypothetical protein
MTTQAPNDCERMTVPEILKELELCTGRFPRRAMQQAVEQREAITPDLLRLLEEVAASPQSFAERKDYMLHIFAMFLLAQFREKRAYRPLITMFSAPGEIPFELAGDTVTEGLRQILASVYDGDPEPLRHLVEDGNVNEYVRAAAMETFVVLMVSNQMMRDDVVAYFRELFHGKLERTPAQPWNWLVSTVADLPAPELLEEVRTAYANRLVEEFFADLPSIEAELLKPGPPDRRGYEIITDAVAEMATWACFREKKPWSMNPKEPVSPPVATHPPQPRPPSATPVRRVKVGRNEPCPCGSGKKYKRCCGNN